MWGKKRVLVLGSGGMLGHVVVEHLKETTANIKVGGMFVFGADRNYFDVLRHPPNMTLDDYKWDYVINCIAMTRQRINDDNKYEAAMINAAFPWRLAASCKARGIKLIHISTPGVFDTLERPGAYEPGAFTESDITYNDDDTYSQTKLWGESPQCMNLRLSIIGHEIGYKKYGLVEWLKASEGQTVNGFVNHYWNGMTTKQAARCIEQIISRKLYTEGVRHIYSSTPISKYATLLAIRDKLNLNVEILQHEHPHRVIETLATEYDLNAKLEIPSVTKQIREDL